MPKLSQITNSPATPVIGDKFIGVNAGTTDYQFDWQQLSLKLINTQTASYTLVLADYNKNIEMNVATANNLTIPTNASVAFPIGTMITAYQIGAGTTTIVAAGGVTLLSTGSAVAIAARYAGVTFYKRATDTWVLTGALA